MNHVAAGESDRLKSEERLFAVIRNTPYVAIQWYDAEGRVLLWNEASEAIFGYTEAEALGKALADLIHTPTQHESFRAALVDVARTGESIGPREFTFRRRNGEQGTCLSSLFKIPGDGGGDWFVCMDVDITQRKQTEAELVKSHEELRAFFSQTIDGCFFMMLDEPVRWGDLVDQERLLDYVFDHHRITQINDAMLEQYGATREQMLGLTPNQLFKHNRAHGRELWRKLFDAGKIRLESDERKVDGTPMWVEGEYIVLRDAQGRITGHFGIQRDITARKQSEQSLRLFRSLTDRVNDSIEVIDPETGRFLDVNEYACRSHGYTREEYLSLTVPDIDPLVAQQPWPEVLESIRRTDNLVHETAHRRKDGTVFPVEVNCSSVHLDREYVLAVVRDISERKRAEAAVRDSDQRLHMALHAANVGLWDWNVLTNEVVYSPEWKRQLGYEADELSDHYDEWWSRLHVDDRPRVVDARDSYLAGRTQEYAVEFRLRHRDGSYRWIYTRGDALRDEQGVPIRMLGCHVDITERKCVEAALRESEQRYKTIFHSAPDALFVMSAEGDDVGRIVAANEQAARMHNTTIGEMVNRNIAEFDTPEAAQRAPDRLRRMAAGERLTFEVEHVRHDGSRIPVEVTAGRIELDGKSHVLAFDRDITDRKRAERAEAERRRLEAQILHAQKLESLGVLAGGIAHDFNNLMTVVLGYASLALMKLTDDSPAAPMLREIEKGAQCATELDAANARLRWQRQFRNSAAAA